MTQTATVLSSGSALAHGGEYLTFLLGEEHYCLEILKVQEIRGYDAVTAIANTPAFIKGVINLRGKIVPIVDLRIKFQLAHVDYNEMTVVIILNLSGRVMGIVVDGVSDVTEIQQSQISDAPALVSNIDNKFIVGLATIADKMLILVNIEHLMSSEEMRMVERVTH